MQVTTLRSVVRTILIATAAMAAHAAVPTPVLAHAVLDTQKTPQDLAEALRVLGRQTQTNIIFEPAIVRGITAPGIDPALATEQAIEELLRGTDLVGERISVDTIVIKRVESIAQKERVTSWAAQPKPFREERTGYAPSGSGVKARVAYAESAMPSPQDADASGRLQRLELEEVLVTGSHIRGAENLSSPVIRIEREEIERSGYSTTQQLLRNLPQNVDTMSDQVYSSITGPGTDVSLLGSAGVDLRGLGTEATLTLLNGRRLAVAGPGSFVDISLVPLSAIERVEVLTDGASALYGSDAVGGVINLVLREDFEGAETRVRFGTVTEGSRDETQVGQMLGHSWGSGQVLASYEYFRSTPLDAGDRPQFQLTSTLPEVDLIPGQKRTGGLVMLHQQLSPRLRVSGDFFYGQRESDVSTALASGTYYRDTEGEQYGAGVGLHLDVAADWQLRLTGLFGQNDMTYVLRRTLAGVITPESGIAIVNRLRSADLVADGSLIRAPGGTVRLAIGAHVRQEDYEDSFKSFLADFGTEEGTDRDIRAGYAEMLIPLVGEQNGRAGLERLELTLAARYEHYSDFGSTFNPKFGFSWAPLSGLNVRGTAGTSFKAPLLDQLSSSSQLAYVQPNWFEDTNGTTTGLELTGIVRDLGPEEAENWTLGFDFTSPTLPGLSLSATYFDIDYDNRISAPFPSGYDTRRVLLDPTYSSIVTRPTQEQVNALIAGATSTLCFDYAAGDLCDIADYAGAIDAVVDSRIRNLAGVRLSGLDFSVGYQRQSAMGNWGMTLSGTKMLKHSRQFVPGAEDADQLDQVYHPVDLRLRSTLTYSRGGWATAASIQYVDDYRDVRTDPLITSTNAKVASWTTVDLTVQYELSRLWQSWKSGGLTLQLAATNLFDRDPPYVWNFYGVAYDPVNANPLGRFVSAQLRATW